MTNKPNPEPSQSLEERRTQLIQKSQILREKLIQSSGEIKQITAPAINIKNKIQNQAEKLAKPKTAVVTTFIIALIIGKTIRGSKNQNKQITASSQKNKLRNTIIKTAKRGIFIWQVYKRISPYINRYLKK